MGENERVLSFIFSCDLFGNQLAVHMDYHLSCSDFLDQF